MPILHHYSQVDFLQKEIEQKNLLLQTLINRGSDLYNNRNENTSNVAMNSTRRNQTYLSSSHSIISSEFDASSFAENIKLLMK